MQLIANQRIPGEGASTERFLSERTEDSFGTVFRIFTPQLVSFFRARKCQMSVAEDLAQEVMLAVYRKAEQIRDRQLFRAWLFKIAHNALCRHYNKQTREVETVSLANIEDGRICAKHKPAGTPAFEFLHWIAFLDSRERDVMKLRFIEQWEYHEIAAHRAIPIGTVQWRIFNAKKKLAAHLATRHEIARNAA
jgi:RNA polymerase sigma-70 factor (ECF subfamily)